MSYGPFSAWDPEATYTAGQRVSYGGYIYEAMTSIAANDNPRTATYSLLGGTFRKWRVWDYPFSYIMARLRGLPENVLANEGGVVSPMPEEIHLVQVRTDFQNNGSPDADLYWQPDSKSSAGYGMPAGMDSNWSEPEEGQLMYSFSAARYEDGAPYAYDYNLGADSGIIYSPTTVAAKLEYDAPSDTFLVLPAWHTETQGQRISCYQTFLREFTFTQPGPSTATQSTIEFQDNWIADADALPDDGTTIATDPAYKDG
jgi:hypothetical protein